ncbi:hypothetical protein Sru01_41380 [Sphaerisporangium rufum]|uniref:Coenzyme Q-binding protein COQ10 START domain-containing protein n=1 Tax=Sphaerisporangium rufum TaxID=1381558 RepID=A0A919R679_9ACTN|nr:SRPBCC family protein [Sphaerisporangium rufum]GII79156.1 hypothetical protein Sru01_41380 [Sphaerisporangium rufum]
MADRANDTCADPAGKAGQGASGLLKDQLRGLAGTAGKLALGAVAQKVERRTEQLRGYASGDTPKLVGQLAGAEGGGGRAKGIAKLAFGGLKKKLGGLKDGLKEKLGFGGGGKGGGQQKLKVTNIVESIDIGAPVRVVYNTWTQFQDWPKFTKKLEKVVQDSDEKITWQVKIWWSRRTWESTIREQVPDERIIWRSKGAKGYVDGAVTFHELGPELTRVLLVLEYNPKGMFEYIGNWWRAQGRRVRLEFKHIRRHIMSEVMQAPDEAEGWRGVIHEGEVVKDHETALREEQEDEGRGPEEEEPEEGAAEDTEESEATEEEDLEPEEGEEPEEEDEEEDEEAAEPEPARRRRGEAARASRRRPESRGEQEPPRRGRPRGGEGRPARRRAREE